MEKLLNLTGRSRPALGRGLRSLIPEPQTVAAEVDMAVPGRALKQIPLDAITAKEGQPRQTFDEDALEELALSVGEHGILQPIVVRQKEEGRYEIVAGERRFRAAKRAGLTSVPCVVSDVADSAMLTLALVENIQRQDLNAIEEAESFRRLSEELEMTQEQIAKAVGRDRATIANAMRLLKLPKETQALVIERRITMGHARALLSVQDTEVITQLARQIEEEGMSVRKTEELVQGYLKAKKAPIATQANATEASEATKETFVEREIRRQLEQTLGTKVELRQQGGDKGSIVIHYSNAEQLNALLAKLSISL